MYHPHVNSNPRGSSLSFHYRHNFLTRFFCFLSAIAAFRIIFLVDDRLWENSGQTLVSEIKMGDEPPCNCTLQMSMEATRLDRTPKRANCTIVVANNHERNSMRLRTILVKLRARQRSELEFVGPSNERNESVVFRNRSRVLVRAFPRRNMGFPCFPNEVNWRGWSTVQRRPAYRGLFYVKTYKTGSTTMMGITMRVAMKMAERYNKLYNTSYEACRARFDHWPAYLLDYRHRERDNSFLFAVLREPTLRAVSM